MNLGLWGSISPKMILGAANRGTVSVGDTTRPTCTITTTAGSSTATSPIPATITFSESVTGFIVGDIVAAIPSGTVTLSNFAGSGAVYTVDCAPSILGTMTLDVAANVAQDAAGNLNTAATQLSVTYNTLTVSIVAAWHLDESSDGSGAVTRVDATGNGNDLTDNNTTPSAVGLLSNACDFEKDNVEALIRASTAGLLVGDIDFTLALWVKPEVGSITHYVASKGSSTADLNTEAWILYINTSNKAVFRVSIGTGSTQIVSTENITAGQWNLLYVWHDSVNNVIGIKVNANADKTTAHSAGVVDASTFPFHLSSAPSLVNNPDVTFDGMMDEACMWKKILSAGEKTALYNGGSGRAYPFFSDPAPVPTITTAESMPSAANPIPITITFSRAVTGLTASDFTVSGCGVSNLVQTTPYLYTASVTPTAASGTVQLGAGVVAGSTDSAANAASNTLAVSSSLTLPTAYINAVMALSPEAYLPMQETTGTIACDISGNDNPLNFNNGYTLNQAGNKGACIQFSTTVLYGLTGRTNWNANIDPREFSIAFWMKLTGTAQLKPCEIWSDANEYFAYECPNLTQVLLLREQGADQSITDLPSLSADTWVHIILYNSESTNRCGMFVNGTQYDFARTLAGTTPPLISNGGGFFGQTMGYAAHLVAWNRTLSQAEVDTIKS